MECIMGDVISFAQTRMCIQEALDARASDNIVQLAWRIRGPLNIAALRAAVNIIIKRHVTLRTRYAITGGRVTAVTDQEPAAQFNIEYAMDAPNEDALRDIVSSLAHLPYRLSSDPVVRVSVIYGPADEILLLVVVHHIAVDGTSMIILAAELSDLYSALVSGRQPVLPEVRVEYPHYAAWQKEWVEGQDAKRQLAYWRQALDGLEELELPADHPRRAGRSPDGRGVPFTFDRKLSTAVAEVSRKNRASVFMFLLAAFELVLSRYADQEDVAVGAPVEGRGNPDFEDVIGLFVNTVVLRSRARHDLTFTEYLRDVREAVLGALENQDIPFDLVVQELRPHRDLARNPLFEVMFSFESMGSAVLRLAGLEVEEFPVEYRTMQFDLGVEIGVFDEGVIGGQMIYAADLFEPPTISRLAEDYERVLRAVTRRPDVRLGEIGLMSAGERAAVIEQAAGPAVARPGCLVHELFEQRAAAVPGGTAVIDGQDELDYERLNGDANQLGHHLRSLGITLDKPAGVFLPRGRPLLTALLAVLKAGGVYLPLDPALSDERINDILAESGTATVITDTTLTPRITAPNLTVVVIDADRSGIEAEDRADLAVKISPDNLACVIYTSGSTGKPQGAAIPHRALLNTLAWSGERHRIISADRIVARSRISAAESLWEMLAPLTTGATLLMAPDDAYGRERLMEFCTENGATVIQVIPSLLGKTLDQPESNRHNSIRLILLGGEVLSNKICQQASSAYDAEIEYAYGSPECAVYALAGRWGGSEVGNSPIGTPIDNVVARVLDSNLNLVPPGFRGILHVGGDCLAQGYLRNARLTAERFIPDPYGMPGARLYVTGDIVQGDQAGVFKFIGRSDRQVKLLGRRVELDDIESALTALPAVSQAAVILAGPETARRLVCYVAGEVGADVNPNSLKRALRKTLPGYMIPSHFVVVREMPSLPSGKTDYGRLREMYGSIQAGAHS
jgi:amino acid adenylation domain-containing protein